MSLTLFKITGIHKIKYIRFNILLDSYLHEVAGAAGEGVFVSVHDHRDCDQPIEKKTFGEF